MAATNLSAFAVPYGASRVEYDPEHNWPRKNGKGRAEGQGHADADGLVPRLHRPQSDEEVGQPCRGPSLITNSIFFCFLFLKNY